MEFNNKINSSVGVTTDTTVSQISNEKVTLISPSKASSKVINASVLVDTVADANGVIVHFSSKEVVDQFDKDVISTKLLTVYGKSGRLYMTSRDVESIPIKPTEFPVRLEYKFITIDDKGVESEYNTFYTVPQFTTSSKLILTGASTNTIQSNDIPSAVSILDNEIYNIKNNLQTFSTFYDYNLKKDVSLQNTITNILTRLDNLVTQVDDLKEKTKDL